MSALASLHDARGRLTSGEPIRILIGHKLYSALEIEPAAPFMADLRATFLADIERQIAALTPPDDTPAAPAVAAKTGAA